MGSISHWDSASTLSSSSKKDDNTKKKDNSDNFSFTNNDYVNLYIYIYYNYRFINI